MKKPKLIYIYPSQSSFIRSDIQFLSKQYDVKTQDLVWSNPYKLPLNWFLQKLFLLKHILSAQAIVISFAGYFSLIPVMYGWLFRKKTLLILNGTDCVSFPEYHYGSLRKPLLRFFIHYSQYFATKLLPVDASLVRQTHTFDKNVKQKEQGFQAFFKSVHTPVKIIPNGFDTRFWNYTKEHQKSHHFMTVVSTNKQSTAIFKGVDLVLEIAKQYPNKSFTIVGMAPTVQQAFDAAENVVFYPFVAKETLKELYQKHQFYLQLSINEGFGCALAEAMLCGCIPIVSDAGALPTVAGKEAFVVSNRTLVDVDKTIKKVLSLSKEEKYKLAESSRNHIVNNYTISRREELLLQEIKQAF